MASLKNYTYILLIFSVSALLSCTSNEQPQKQQEEKITNFQADPENGGIELPDGFFAVVVAQDLGRGRKLAIRENGDIYLSLRRLNDGKGIVALRDTTNDGKADIIKYFGEYAGDGLEIKDNFLYFSSKSTVMRYEFNGDELLPKTEPQILITGFPDQNQHDVKPFAFDKEGHIYVNVGAPSNACMQETRTPGSPGMDPCPELQRQAGVWRFDANTAGQTQIDDGYHFSTGIRHAVAISWNPYVDKLYAVQHGRDQLNQFFPEYYTEDDGVTLPAEEFLLLEDGADFGWPYCYYDPFKDQKLLAPEYGGDSEKTGRCSTKKDPIMAFPAHTAPNDLIFYDGESFPEKYHKGAFIAFHGSWNRAPQEQKGYYVMFVPFKDSLPSGKHEIFAEGFKGVEKVMSPRDAQYRPTGLATGPDGSLFIVESNTGKIWRILYNRKES